MVLLEVSVGVDGAEAGLDAGRSTMGTLPGTASITDAEHEVNCPPSYVVPRRGNPASLPATLARGKSPSLPTA
ncbi:hypothetical protein ASD06_12885 [Angustibacter sp. Root456]|nr:hypothetical protein ASD06_12885 [Angustibacter sp. Root456]